MNKPAFNILPLVIALCAVGSGVSFAQSSIADKSSASLVGAILDYERQMAAADAAVERLERKIDDISSRLERLKPRPTTPFLPADPAKPATVGYRPPMLRISKKSTDLAVICRGKRLYLLDLGAMSIALQGADTSKTGIRVLPSGDFDIRIERWALVGARGNSFVFAPQCEAVLKSGTRGETAAEIATYDSRYQTRLSELDATSSALQFMVFPDSFDLFRHARKLAWDRSFSLGWIPQEAGASIGVGGGGSGVGVQN